MKYAAHGLVAQKVERETEDLRVDGSIPSGSAAALWICSLGGGATGC